MNILPNLSLLKDYLRIFFSKIVFFNNSIDIQSTIKFINIVLFFLSLLMIIRIILKNKKDLDILPNWNNKLLILLFILFIYNYYLQHNISAINNSFHLKYLGATGLGFFLAIIYILYNLFLLIISFIFFISTFFIKKKRRLYSVFFITFSLMNIIFSIINTSIINSAIYDPNILTFINIFILSLINISKDYLLIILVYFTSKILIYITNLINYGDNYV